MRSLHTLHRRASKCFPCCLEKAGDTNSCKRIHPWWLNSRGWRACVRARVCLGWEEPRCVCVNAHRPQIKANKAAVWLKDLICANVDSHIGPSSVMQSKAHDEVVPRVAQNWKTQARRSPWWCKQSQGHDSLMWHYTENTLGVGLWS